MVDVAQNDINELYGLPAPYCDRIYSSHDKISGLVRLGFAETIQGTSTFKARAAVVITEAGLNSLIDLLVNVQKKLNEAPAEAPTIQ